MKVKQIANCSLCGSNQLTTYLDFGSHPLANDLKTAPNEKTDEYPLRVAKCAVCYCFQLLDIVNPKILFKNYNYESPKNMEEHFKEYAQKNVKTFGLDDTDLVVEIGSNTGLLLKQYSNLGLATLGVEPAKNIAKLAAQNQVDTICDFFTPEVATKIRKSTGPAALICANNVLCHTSLKPIIDGIKILLDKDGYLVQENAYWPKTLEMNDLGQIYSEHQTYATITSLSTFYAKNGFKLFDVEFNNMHNGSFRAYIKWANNKKMKFKDVVLDTINKESDSGIFNKEYYNDFMRRLNNTKDYILEKLRVIKGNKQRIGLYGYPAKIFLPLRFFGLDTLLDFAVDDSALKLHKYIPGTAIQIKSREEFLKNPPDYMIIGAANYAEDIIKKNQKVKTQWITILPSFKLID